MNCPRCNSWADVVETRTREDHTKRRRYECINGHRFTTLEHIKEEIKGRAISDRPNKSFED